MSFNVFVPARLAATRLPDKPLADLAGKPMLVRVLDQAAAAGAQRVVAATDSTELAKVAKEAGHEVVLTGEHPSGSARVAAAARELDLLDQVNINLQGDIPEIEPKLIAAIAAEVATDTCDCATVAAPISAAQAADPHLVKVVTAHQGRALYFSRAQIPFARDPATPPRLLGHVGVYAFGKGKLKYVSEMRPSPLEAAEALEQLTWLWAGWRIAVVETDSFVHGIDTPEDLAAARQRLAGRPGDG